MGRLRAGVCRVDITPPLGVEPGAWRLRTGRADGVHEPLVAQALVLDDGSRRIALVATDLLWVPRHVAEAARRRAATLTGIPADAILLNASHNHSAPVLVEHQRLSHERLVDPVGAPRPESPGSGLDAEGRGDVHAADTCTKPTHFRSLLCVSRKGPRAPPAPIEQTRLASRV